MVERREILKLLAAAGALRPLSAGAQNVLQVTPETLERAAALLDSGIESERLREILPAVQRNLDFFAPVRDLEVADEIEPAPIFRADRKAGE